ncbi:MAG: thiamine pyrophosphate-dependent enzyme [Euryarchaeota archaeon]|nr:thiamine pyrophosphate-dependent enzyme [Euryarchaeota archaeon]
MTTDNAIVTSNESAKSEPERLVADMIVEQLKEWGVKQVYGIPGETSLQIVDAIRRSDTIRFILVRHEEVAAFMASAYAKLTGQMGVCLTIAGPGATNLVTGLYDAKMDHAPVLALTGQVGLQFLGLGSFQEIDQHALFEAVADFNQVIDSPEQVTELLTIAMKHAIVEQGVAHLGVPANVQALPIPANMRTKTREGRLPDLHFLPRPELINTAADVINAAKKPVIIVGYGARDQRNAILRIAEKLGAPIATTYKAKGIIPEDHRLALGVMGSIGTDPAKRVVYGADLLMVIGSSYSDLTSIPSFIKQVQIDRDPMTIGRKFPIHVGLLADIGTLLPVLDDRLVEKQNDVYLAQVSDIKAQWEQKKQDEISSGKPPVRGPQVMNVLQQVVDSDAIIANDVGDNTLWFARNFVATDQRILISGYVASMGFGLPAALAAQLTYPDKQVVCTTGDGGFTMVMGDFVTAVANDLPITVILLDNAKLAMIETEQDEAGVPHFATNLQKIDFAEYANSCGGEGFKVEKPGELKSSMQKALASEKATLVDIATDPRRRWS